MRYFSQESDLPERSAQHQSETDSAKIFNDHMPKEWVVRGLSERDYGIDFYIEIVDKSNLLKGDLVSVQLKSLRKSQWTQNGTVAVSTVKKTTTNYWANNVVPVFVVLADLTTRELYYLSVKDYIRKNYLEFKKDSFTYHFSRAQSLSSVNSLDGFVKAYYLEVERERFETTLVTVISSLNNYIDFIWEHSNRDFHMVLEPDEIIQIEAILNNYQFLCKYLGVQTELPTIEQLKENSIDYYKSGYEDLYEGDLAKIFPDLKQSTIDIVKKAQDITEREQHYWLMTNAALFSHLNNLEAEDLFNP
jgi:hypothetical protein